MIRQQQAQIQQLQLSQTSSNNQSQAIDDSTPTSERSMSLSHQPSNPSTQPTPAQPSAPSSSLPRSRSPFHPHSSLSRQSSYRSSRNASPLMRPTSGVHEREGSTDFTIGQPARERDDAAFYAAEAQSLNRENAMLRQRIRELERQLSRERSGSTGQSPTAATGSAEAGAAAAGARMTSEETKEEGT
jgi:hypothetical protein